MPEPDRLAVQAVPAEFRHLLQPPRRPGELGRVAHYRVLQVLGRGGMGIVFRAEDKLLQRPVALKVLKREALSDIVARERFYREGRLAASIKHDNIVTVYQVGEDKGLPFLAMELLSGSTLETWLGLNRPTVPQVLRFGREIASGLAAAHSRGLIHRDVKPANIWLESPSNRVKLLDFGLARMVEDPSNLTGTGIVVGTPAYISPEQATGNVTGPRGDLFSLGCVMYELCTGRLPFPGQTVLVMLTNLATRSPEPVKSFNPQVPDALSALIAQLLEKDPEDRPADADAVVRVLQALEVGAEVPSGLRPSPRSGALATVTSVRQTQPTSRAHPTVKLRSPSDEKSRMNARSRLSAARDYAVAAAVAFLGAAALGVAGYVAAIRWIGSTGDTIRASKSHTKAVAPPQLVGNQFPPLDPSWAMKLQSHSPPELYRELIDELKRRNPNFTGTDCSYALTNNRIVKVFLVSEGLCDLTPLRALPDLRNVAVISGKGKSGGLIDLSPLSGLELTDLRINGMPRLADLRPLKDMPLQQLDLTGTGVNDLSPLIGAPLRELYLGWTPVNNLSPLSQMPLESLDLRGTNVNDYSPLVGTPLRVLNANLVPQRDAALIRSLTFLTTVNGRSVTEFLGGS